MRGWDVLKALDSKDGEYTTTPTLIGVDAEGHKIYKIQYNATVCKNCFGEVIFKHADGRKIEDCEFLLDALLYEQWEELT